MCSVSLVTGTSGLGTDDLGEEEAGRARSSRWRPAGGRRWPGSNPAAWRCRRPARRRTRWRSPPIITVISSEGVIFATNGLISERGLRLAQEDVAAGGQRLRARGAQRLLHHPGDALHDPLHHAQVVEHRHQRRHEDDGGQHAEGEDRQARPPAGCPRAARSPPGSRRRSGRPPPRSRARRLTSRPTFSKNQRPGAVFSTRTPKTPCSARPAPPGARARACGRSSSARR